MLWSNLPETRCRAVTRCWFPVAKRLTRQHHVQDSTRSFRRCGFRHPCFCTELQVCSRTNQAGENGGRAARGVRPRLGQHQLQGARETHLGAERTAQRLALRRGQGRLQQGHRRAGTDRRQGADVPHCVQEATGHAVHRPGQQIPEPRKERGPGQRLGRLGRAEAEAGPPHRLGERHPGQHLRLPGLVRQLAARVHQGQQACRRQGAGIGPRQLPPDPLRQQGHRRRHPRQQAVRARGGVRPAGRRARVPLARGGQPSAVRRTERTLQNIFGLTKKSSLL